MKELDLQLGDRITYYYKDNTDNSLLHKVVINNDNELSMYQYMIEFETIFIIKIERPKYEVVAEWKEKKDLLTEEEKEFLKDMCKYYDIGKIAFDIDFNHIKIYDTNNKDDCMLACIDYPKSTKFKNIEKYKYYTLKELGLED